MPKREILGKLKKYTFIALGLFFLVIGVIGYFLPGLPGTIWLIIAASLFVRSSDRLYRLVVNNKIFGPGIRDFLETGRMPARAKIMSLTFIWGFSLASVIFAPYTWLFDVPILLMAILGTIYIATRPTARNQQSPPITGNERSDINRDEKN